MRASAPAKRLAPQEVRTFFISAAARGRRGVLQTSRMARLFLDVLRENRKKERFQMHAFVVMPNHVHALVTPAADVSLEKCVQYIKGGFSFRAKKELGFAGGDLAGRIQRASGEGRARLSGARALHSRKPGTGRNAR